jgi:SAM-dependent methyltransferase
MDKIKEQQEIDSLGPWFSVYDFGNDLKTKSARNTDSSYFKRRAERIFHVLTHLVDPPQSTLLDVGCADGYFSFEAARQGFKSVFGVDFRPDHVARARHANRYFCMNNVNFEIGNVYDLSSTQGILNRYDIVLFQGLLYHLENPVLAMRNIAKVTSKICFVAGWTKTDTVAPSFRIEAESDDYIQGDTNISMRPSPDAMHKVCSLTGFQRTFEYDLATVADCQWNTNSQWRELFAIKDSVRHFDCSGPRATLSTPLNKGVKLQEGVVQPIPRSYMRKLISTIIRGPKFFIL